MLQLPTGTGPWCPAAAAVLLLLPGVGTAGPSLLLF
jgi:hypothetical protein